MEKRNYRLICISLLTVCVLALLTYHITQLVPRIYRGHDAMEDRLTNFSTFSFRSHLSIENEYTSISAIFHKTSVFTCNISRTYHPSGLERKWFNIIDSMNDKSREWKKGCSLLRNDIDQIELLLKLYEKWKVNVDKSWSIDFIKSNDVLSYFSTEENCGDGRVVQYVPIEPLIGFLRHPTAYCIDSNRSLVDKEYMFLLNNAQISPSAKRNRAVAKNYLFDLGASLYNKGSGGASQQWFFNEYQKRGIEFDRIFCWESSKMTPDVIIESYPHNVVDKISYFNLNADENIHSKMSPIRMIKSIVKVTDLLVLKIDIDNDPVEMSIIYSFINDPTVTHLIDEFFFEHHVSYSPMERLAWGRGKKVMNISQSYQLFGHLRAAGIRAHSWV